MTSNQSCFNALNEPRSLLIDNAKLILTRQGIIQNSSIFIEKRRIQAIGDKSDLRQRFGSWEEELNAKNCLVMPGFVNNHSHVAMALLRGLAEDLPLLNWLRDKIWPLEKKLKPWQIEIGAALGSAEALLSGTTTVTSIYFYDPSGSEASAIEKIGLRG